MRRHLISIVCFLLAGCLMLTACGGGASSTPDDSDVVLPDGSTDNATVTTGDSADASDTDASNDTTGTDVGGDTTTLPSGDATGTQGTGAPTTVGTSPVKPTGGNGSTTQKTQVTTTTTTTMVSGGDGKLNVKDGELYQPANGKYNNYIKYRNTLANTYSKLTKDKKLKVVYFGGSVTVGYGASNQDTKSWRAMIGQWLKDSFPNAEVTNLNHGTGESGTYLGSYRFQRDVVEADPDLVFIEYSINDLYANATYEQAASQYEAIVRGIRKQLPDCDIVTILVTDQGRANGQLHEQAKAHEDVSIAYGIPTVHVGRALAMHLIDNAFTDQWSNYMIDIVHPTEAGYAKYASYMQEFLADAFASKAVPSSLKKTTLPKETLSTLPKTPHAVNFSGLTFQNDYFEVGSNGSVIGYQSGKSFTFEFTGTELKFWVYGTADGSTASVSIDGKFAKSVDMSGSNHKVVTVATGLSAGKHTVKVILGTANGKCYMEVWRVFMSGAGLEGITITK